MSEKNKIDNIPPSRKKTQETKNQHINKTQKQNQSKKSKQTKKQEQNKTCRVTYLAKS
jgi:hypothetical protein